jgi:hypothetical protein
LKTSPPVEPRDRDSNDRFQEPELADPRALPIGLDNIRPAYASRVQGKAGPHRRTALTDFEDSLGPYS